MNNKNAIKWLYDEKILGISKLAEIFETTIDEIVDIVKQLEIEKTPTRQKIGAIIALGIILIIGIILSINSGNELYFW